MSTDISHSFWFILLPSTDILMDWTATVTRLLTISLGTLQQGGDYQYQLNVSPIVQVIKKVDPSGVRLWTLKWHCETHCHPHSPQGGIFACVCSCFISFACFAGPRSFNHAQWLDRTHWRMALFVYSVYSLPHFNDFYRAGCQAIRDPRGFKLSSTGCQFVLVRRAKTGKVESNWWIAFKVPNELVEQRFRVIQRWENVFEQSWPLTCHGAWGADSPRPTVLLLSLSMGSSIEHGWKPFVGHLATVKIWPKETWRQSLGFHSLARNES